MSINIKSWLEGEGRYACSEARKWMRSLGPDATMQDAWEKCHRVDWMIWAASDERSKIGANDQRWRLAGCAIVRRTTVCDRTLWGLLTDSRSRNAVDVSERFANGEASREELVAARVAARAAVLDVEWDTARAAAWDTAWAAALDTAQDAAQDAARVAAGAAAGAAACAASWAAEGAAARAAAWDAAWVAAGAAAGVEHANILREFITNPWGE